MDMMSDNKHYPDKFQKLNGEFLKGMDKISKVKVKRKELEREPWILWEEIADLKKQLDVSSRNSGVIDTTCGFYTVEQWNLVKT